MSDNNDNQYRNTDKDKKIRRNIFLFVGILALITTFVMVKPYIFPTEPEITVKQDKEKKVEETSTYQDNMELFNYLYLPDNVKESDLTKSNDNSFVIENDDIYIEYVKGLSLEEKELELAVYNPLQFYAFQLETLIQPRYKLKNLTNYITVDEFYNSKHTFYAIAFPEDNKYKYVVFNTYKDNGKTKLAYFYIEFKQNNTNLYNPDAEIDETYHKKLLNHIFSKFEHDLYKSK